MLEARPAEAQEPMLPRPYVVARVHKDTADTFTLDLHALDGQGLVYRPGQFTMLYAFGVGEVPISVSGDPTRSDPLVQTIRAVGPVSKALTDVKRDEMIGVRGPFGSAWPMEEAVDHDVVLMAGGIGLAPLRPALYYMLAHRDRYRRITLLYGSRTPADLLFRQELERWRGRLDLDVAVTVDNATTAWPVWRGGVGVVTTLIPRAHFDPASTIAMICGPDIMMRYSARDLQELGVRDERIYLSIELNMQCGIGLCGHCQFGPTFVCKNGPIYRLDQVAHLLAKREI